MRFRKYSGELRSKIPLAIFFIVLLIPLSIFMSIRSKDYRLLFFFGLPLIVYVITSTWLFFFKMFRDDKANISDMIVIDEEGIKLECKSGENKSISWENITKIEKKSFIGLSPLIYVTSVSGEEIWWYVANKKAEQYILEQHPELADIFTAW